MKNTVHNWRPFGKAIFAGLKRDFLSYAHRKCTRCGAVQTITDQRCSVWVDGMTPTNEYFYMKNSNERAACDG